MPVSAILIVAFLFVLLGVHLSGTGPSLALSSGGCSILVL